MNLNQANKQFNIDLQLFAEDSAADVTDTTSEPATESEPASDSESKNIGEMSEEEQIAFVQKKFIEPESKDTNEQQDGGTASQVEDSPQPKVTHQSERMVTLTHNGKQVQVPESEAINLAMQGYDYTKKMQALADERRHYEQLIAQMTANRQAQPQTQTPQAQPLDNAFNAAVAAAERLLGVGQGEFNQFDPRHNFALQQIIAAGMLNHREQQARQAAWVQEQHAVKGEVTKFFKDVEKDPLAQQISDNFEKYMYKLCTNEQGVTKAAQIGDALTRFYANNGAGLTMNDCKILREHWDYIKKDMQKIRPTAKPPMTESPGAGTDNTRTKVFSKSKVRELAEDPDKQMAYLMQTGVLN